MVLLKQDTEGKSACLTGRTVCDGGNPGHHTEDGQLEGERRQGPG